MHLKILHIYAINFCVQSILNPLRHSHNTCNHDGDHIPGSIRCVISEEDQITLELLTSYHTATVALIRRTSTLCRRGKPTELLVDVMLDIKNQSQGNILLSVLSLTAGGR